MFQMESMLHIRERTLELENLLPHLVIECEFPEQLSHGNENFPKVLPGNTYIHLSISMFFPLDLYHKKC